MTLYASKTQKSAKAFSEACVLMPGGVNSPVRAFGGVDLKPIFIDSGRGSRIYDIDGNEYIDYVCSWGAMILGHCHPKVVEAVKKQAEKGLSFGAATVAETELAERIVSAFDSIEKVRLVNSGTEAVMTAIRLARAFTGREMIVKMIGCYHGHSDSLLVSAGSGLAEQGIASSGGVPESLAKLTIAIPYNDIAAVKEAFKRYGAKIAAVLVEPVAANMGVILPKDGYLAGLRNLCDENGAILIFDEVITGFRVAFGGAQQLYGVRADLTCLGKVAGGGLPGAAFGGKAEIMDILSPQGAVYQAGTLSGNPLMTAAANATLEVLSDGDCYRQLEESSACLEKGIWGAAKEVGVSLSINRVGSIISCFFAQKPVKDFADVQASDIGRFKKFFAEMLSCGVYLAPSAYEAMFISLAHSENDIAKTIEAAHNSFKRIRKDS